MGGSWNRLAKWADEEVRRLRLALPVELRDRFDSITLFLEELPPGFMLDEGVADDTMGLFEGPAFAEEGDIELPARMTLYVLNIWEEAGRKEGVFRKEVRITLLHELGHYLGLNEGELTDRELE
jgi:predicted Zn-dependent protease with MMP-like domain